MSSSSSPYSYYISFSHFSTLKFKKRDAIVIGITVLCLVPIVMAITCGSFDTVFYPLLKIAEPDTINIIGYVSYVVMILIPIILKLMEKFRWKYLMSKI